MNQTELHTRVLDLFIESLDAPHRLLLDYCRLSIEVVIAKSENTEYKVETCLNIDCPSAFGRTAIFVLGSAYYMEKATAVGIKRIDFSYFDNYQALDWCAEPENTIL